MASSSTQGYRIDMAALINMPGLFYEDFNVDETEALSQQTFEELIQAATARKVDFFLGVIREYPDGKPKPFFFEAIRLERHFEAKSSQGVTPTHPTTRAPIQELHYFSLSDKTFYLRTSHDDLAQRTSILSVLKANDGDLKDEELAKNELLLSENYQESGNKHDVEKYRARAMARGYPFPSPPSTHLSIPPISPPESKEERKTPL